MTNLNSMTYEEFGKLRFLNHFPKNSEYHHDVDGGFTSGIGYACTEGYQSTYFAQLQETPSATGEITLEFSIDCPEDAGNSLLNTLGLGIKKGMSMKEVEAQMGRPTEARALFFCFVIGNEWPFYVTCLFDRDKGLSKVWIGRKDLADRFEESA